MEQLEGQMNILDFLPDPNAEPIIDADEIQNKILDDVLKRLLQLCNNWLELSYDEKLKEIKKNMKFYGGGCPEYLWQCSVNGVDIKFNKPIGKTVGLYTGWPMFIKRYSPIKVDVRGICDDGYCPVCNSSLNDLVFQCSECKSWLDWSDWKIMNDYEG